MKKTLVSCMIIAFFMLISVPLKSLCQTSSLETFLKLTESETKQLDFGKQVKKETSRKTPARKRKFYYNAEKLAKGVENFHANFKYKDKNTDLKNTNDQIKISDLISLYNQLNMSPKSNSIGMLKMVFGRVDNKMVIFYQPIAFPRIGNKYKFSITQNPSDKPYYWVNPDSNKFEQFSQAYKGKDRDSIIKDYTKSADMYIKHRTSRHITRFIDGDGLIGREKARIGDVKYCLFTFQHLVEMVAYLNYHKDISSESDTEITFSIVASNNIYWGYRNKYRTKNYKLHIVAHHQLDRIGKIGNTDNEGADFTQMPPSGFTEIDLSDAWLDEN